MKLLKIALAITAALIVLIIAVAAIVVWRVDPNAYKGHATAWLESRTGRPVTIDGHVELQLFPWLAIEAADVTVGNPAGFAAEPPFATVERFAAGLRLMPLLERRIELDRVRAGGLRLNFMRGDDGRGNWEDFGELGASSGAPAAPEPPGAAPAGPLDAVDVRGVEIVDAELIWHEGGAPRYVLRNIDLETGAIRAGSPLDAALALEVTDAASGRRFDVETAARIELPTLGLAAARGGPGDGTAGGAGVDPGAEAGIEATAGTGAETAAGAGADAGTGTTVVRVFGFSLTLAVADPADGELLSGRVAVERAEAAADGRFAAVGAQVAGQLAPTVAVPGGLPFAARASTAVFDPSRGTFSLDGLTTEVAGVETAWDLAGRNLFDAPEADIRFETHDAPLGRALSTFGVELPAGLGAETLAAVDAAGELSAAFELIAPDSGEDGIVAGPYRLVALRVPAFTVNALGASVEGTATLARDGRVTGEIAVPAFTPGEPLRAALAPHLPAELDLAALDQLAAAAKVDARPADGIISVQDVRVDLLGSTVTGALDIAPNAAADGRVLRGTLSTSPLDSARLAALLGPLRPGPLTPERLGTLRAEVTFDHDTAAGRSVLDPLSLELFGLAAEGRAQIVTGRNAASISGDLRVAEFSPRDLMARFGQTPPETSDPNALSHATIATRFEAGDDVLRLTAAELLLDNSRISGDFTLDGLATPTYRFALAIDSVNVDRYLPPQSGDLPSDAPEDARTAGDLELPTDALSNLAIDGHVSVGALRIAGLDFTGVETGILIGDGRGTLDPARANLYGGRFEGRFDVNGAETPSLRLTGRATSLQLEPLITALTGDANLSGSGDFEIDLSGRGATVIENVDSASGRAQFAMRDGAIEGFNLGHALCRVYNTVSQQPAPSAQPARTAYQLIRGSASVQNGVATTNDLLARAPFMDLTGTGSLALTEQRLDYTLEAALTGSTGIPGCEPMDRLVGESLPLVLRGTVTEPDIRPDFSKLVERRVRDEIRDRIQDRVQDRLRDLLR